MGGCKVLRYSERCLSSKPKLAKLSRGGKKVPVEGVGAQGGL